MTQDRRNMVACYRGEAGGEGRVVIRLFKALVILP